MEYTTKAGKNTQTIPTDFHNGWLDSLDYRTAMAKEMRGRFVALTNDLSDRYAGSGPVPAIRSYRSRGTGVGL
jgi:hypothetical protein